MTYGVRLDSSPSRARTSLRTSCDFKWVGSVTTIALGRAPSQFGHGGGAPCSAPATTPFTSCAAAADDYGSGEARRPRRG
jgi:hypothetical protein